MSRQAFSFGKDVLLTLGCRVFLHRAGSAISCLLIAAGVPSSQEKLVAQRKVTFISCFFPLFGGKVDGWGSSGGVESK